MSRRTQTVIYQINNIIWWLWDYCQKSHPVVILMNAIQHLIQTEDMVNALDILETPENFKQELENSNKKNSVLVIFLLRAKN